MEGSSISNIKRRPEKERVDIDDLEEKDMNICTGGMFYDYMNKPFTGFMIHGYFENGQISGETEYVNGEDIGWVIEYYENGNTENESLQYGATNVYFADYKDDGTKISSHFFARELLQKVCAITGEDPDNVKE